MRIEHVVPDSIAEHVGLAPGDRLIRINRARVRDSLDYRFWSSEDVLELDIIQSNSILLDSKISLANFERNYFLAQFKLLQAIGLLNIDHLKLQ